MPYSRTLLRRTCNPRVHYPIDVNVDTTRRGAVLLLDFVSVVLSRCQPRFSHSSLIVFFCIGVQGTRIAVRVLAVWRLTKVRIGIVAVEQLAAKVAHFGSAPTRHFVATIALDDSGFILKGKDEYMVQR